MAKALTKRGEARNKLVAQKVALKRQPSRVELIDLVVSKLGGERETARTFVYRTVREGRDGRLKFEPERANRARSVSTGKPKAKTAAKKVAKPKTAAKPTAKKKVAAPAKAKAPAKKAAPAAKKAAPVAKKAVAAKPAARKTAPKAKTATKVAPAPRKRAAKVVDPVEQEDILLIDEEDSLGENGVGDDGEEVIFDDDVFDEDEAELVV